MNICTQIAILHRHEITKHFLNYFLSHQPENFGCKSFYSNIKRISEVSNKSMDYVINFPGITRNNIIKEFFDIGDNEMEFILIDDLIQNYNFVKKKCLKDLYAIKYKDGNSDGNFQQID